MGLRVVGWPATLTRFVPAPGAQCSVASRVTSPRAQGGGGRLSWRDVRRMLWAGLGRLGWGDEPSACLFWVPGGAGGETPWQDGPKSPFMAWGELMCNIPGYKLDCKVRP